jgi:hypothetical protein
MKAIGYWVSCLCLAAGALANPHRGAWFWHSPSSACGAAHIVGNPALEAETVAFMTSRRVKRVYGSYKNLPVDDPSVMAAWNARLHEAGISSQLLLAEPTWVQPANRPNLLAKVTARVIDFNLTSGRTAPERFDAVHLDLEPQQLPAWDAGTPADKRAFLDLLLTTYAELRAHLDAAGQNEVGLYADLPVWFDKLPADGGSVGWANTADRDNWYAAISEPLSGISLMAFGRDQWSSISNAVSRERALVTGAVVRVAVQADIGPGKTWGNIGDFNSMLDTLEGAYGGVGAVDVENYRLWREALAAQPIRGVSADLTPRAPAGDVLFVASRGGTYVVLGSPDLYRWKEVRRLRSPVDNMETKVAVDLSGPRGYWRIYRFDDAPW